MTAIDDAGKLVGEGDRDQLERLGLHPLLRPAPERVGRLRAMVEYGMRA